MKAEDQGDGPYPPSDRMIGIDIARAAAVIGVVVNHGVDGLISANLLSLSSTIASLNQFLYTFRMPALAFIIGLFIPGGVRRVGRKKYVYRRVTTVLYLYVLWFYLQGTVEVASSGVKNHPRSLWAFLQPWAPFGQLWFLPYLALATGLIVVCRPWVSILRALTSLVFSLVVSICVWGWNPDLAGLHGLALILFSILGSVVGLPAMARFLRMRLNRVVALLIVCGGAAWLSFEGGAVPPTQGKEHADLLASTLGITAGVSGTMMLLMAATLIARFGGKISAFLARVGQQTLPIYLGHVAVVGAIRLLLTNLGVGDARVILWIAVPLGVLLPFWAGLLAGRNRFTSWIFEPPRVLLKPALQRTK